MKITELVLKRTYRYSWSNSERSYYSARSETNKILNTYDKADVVVAYVKSLLGNVFLIKGKKSCFGFITLKEPIIKFGRYETERISIEETIKLINESPEKVILNQDVFDEEIKKMVINKI